MRLCGVTLGCMGVVCLVGFAVSLQSQNLAGENQADTDPDGQAAAGWFPFNPGRDPFDPSPIDLRFLNEKTAGENGFILSKHGKFVHADTGKSVRFWAVNGPPDSVETTAEMEYCARLLAKYGVNLVRVHGPVFDKEGKVDPEKVRRAHKVVECMKKEGIYTHFSIYFPLWFEPEPGNEFLRGYNGNQKPFAALFFNPDFQTQYREWWKALLLTPHPDTGGRLVDDPAVFGLEMQNEDSFFFWTFSPDNLPPPQLERLETQFAGWLMERYGSLENALKEWKQLGTPRDRTDEGRMGFRALYNMFQDKTKRDRDTARFLYELQTEFYVGTRRFLRDLGFKGVITASNWHTANEEVFGPIENLSYHESSDFIDRHGYFGCFHKGENAAWSIRNGHTYLDRSALRFDPDKPGDPVAFSHPVMDIQYGDKPSMISETTFNRPNRFRSEAPLYFAAYGSLQGTDAIVHFALDGLGWQVKPRYWMQPWTLMSPAMIGQFPAAALIYRRNLVKETEPVVTLNLDKEGILNLSGTPLPLGAHLDELRQVDLPTGSHGAPRGILDPLVHYTGATRVRFMDGKTEVRSLDLSQNISRDEKTVRSRQNELILDYGKGTLVVESPQVAAMSGHLKSLGKRVFHGFIEMESALELGHFILVSLDEKPLVRSERMLLQVMSEEQNSGWMTDEPSTGVRRIQNLGKDPWVVKTLTGTITFKPETSRTWKCVPLDSKGSPESKSIRGPQIRLLPETTYYLVETDR